MRKTDKVEGEIPVLTASSRAPLGVRRSGDYLEKVEVAGGSICLLSRHVEYEMSRIELAPRVRFALAPRGATHQSIYVLTGELVSLTHVLRLRPSSSFQVDGDTEPLLFEASYRTMLLYFSTANDFHTLAGCVGI